MIVLDREPVPAQGACDPLAGFARARVDDGTAALDPAEAFDEDAQAVLVAGHLLDVVAQVRPDDARPYDRELATEGLRDLGSRRPGVAVAVSPSSGGSPSAPSARRMKR